MSARSAPPVISVVAGCEAIEVVDRRWLAWARAEPEGPRTVLTGVVWYQEGEKPSAFGKVWVRLPWLDGPR